MNCNLIIHDDYEHVSNEIKQLSKKSNLRLEKGPDCFFKIDEENPNIKWTWSTKSSHSRLAIIC